MADELLEIADDATNDFVERQNKDGHTSKVFDAEHVQRSRLRVEARKWLLSKALPKTAISWSWVGPWASSTRACLTEWPSYRRRESCDWLRSDGTLYPHRTDHHR
jgi:hypothetical protein